MMDYLGESEGEKMDIKLIIWGPHKIIWGPRLGSQPQVWEPLTYIASGGNCVLCGISYLVLIQSCYDFTSPVEGDVVSVIAC